MVSQTRNGRALALISALGAFGAFIGFLLRPSVTLVGQLPFSVVITRGSQLRGLDQILVSAAETSFNYVLAGFLLGVVVGLNLYGRNIAK